MRGLLLTEFCMANWIRITPALAGTTIQFFLKFYLNQDHPRACGDYFEVREILKMSLGSPPRLRGLLFACALVTVGIGITPALAGTTQIEEFKIS